MAERPPGYAAAPMPPTPRPFPAFIADAPDVTLVWGLPLVRGAVAATAEIDEEVLDQVAVVNGRFTLVAVDALHGFGEDLYLEVKLWDRQLREVAAESLYEEAEPQEAE